MTLLLSPRISVKGVNHWVAVKTSEILSGFASETKTLSYNVQLTKDNKFETFQLCI